MGAVDAPQPRAAKKGKGGKRPKRRIGIRMDMTPMVDVAFLLLIFFMVTTVFRTPQALEINLPENNATAPVAQSKVLEVRVLVRVPPEGQPGTPEDVAYFRNSADPWARSDIGKLTTVFGLYKNDADKIVLVKVDRRAKFSDMVFIIDELDLAKLTRFSLQTLSEAELKEVEAL
jgi:biopolymer transport protein ExbD